MPPYHSVAGNEIKVYLDAEEDPNDEQGLAFPFHDLLTEVGKVWPDIAADWNFKMVFIPGPNTDMWDSDYPNPINTAPVDDAMAVEKIRYSFLTESPPAGVEFFKLKVGRGQSARPETRGGQISYVEYLSGKGYIYLKQSGGVTDISHELGHILGLADRYYEGVVYTTDFVIERTCFEIRTNQWFDAEGNDQRNKTFAQPNSKEPYYAERSSIVMHKKAVPEDSQYQPGDNLMSSGSSTLTEYQLVKVGLKQDPNISQGQEHEIRKQNYIALLAQDDDQFFVWEDEGPGKGLLYYEGNKDTDPVTGNENTPKRYACWRRAVDENNQVVMPEKIVFVMGKKKEWHLLNKRYKLTNKLVTQFPDKRKCYWKRLILDLE